MMSHDTVLSILILYGTFLTIPLLFFVLYIIFKTSEREKDEIFKEVTKRKARAFAWEKAQGTKSEAAPAIAM